MPDSRAHRTLVKSPPELWAEISDARALGRLLNDGEVRITRLDPETTVAWEGDRVRGTVELEASGWGTKVTLTAQPAEEALPGRTAEEEEEVAPPSAAPARETAPLPAARRPGLLALFRRRPRGEAPPEQPVPEPELPAEGVARGPVEVPTAVDAAAVEAVLVGVLDDLGSAQKRPFSR